MTGGAAGRPVPRDALRHEGYEALLDSLPAGDQRLWGVPFVFGAGDAADRWLWLGAGSRHRSLSVPVDGRADYVIFAHFSLPSHGSRGRDRADQQPRVQSFRAGDHLADYVLVYADATEFRTAVRRRFEVNDLTVPWGNMAYACRPHRQDLLLDWRGPHGDRRWGRNQQSCDGPAYYGWLDWLGDPAPELANYWLFALANPYPERPLAGLRLERVAGCVGVGAITLFEGPCHPLRHRPLGTVRVSIHDGAPEAEPQLGVDLGVLGHRRRSGAIDHEAWLEETAGSWRDPVSATTGDLLVEVAANEAATLEVDGHAVAMGDLYRDGAASSADRAVRVELLPAERMWVKGAVIDASTGRPTPARIHVHAPDGRYLPPYGHRREVNDRWFEDYGADLQLGSTPYAYVDGEFDILLPPGEAYVEVVKGFEHRPVRTRVLVEPGQRELRLTLERPLDWRRRGWVTADTHVHFLSPQTAWLEARAEGVNVVNLLASQWGDLFTNVGDFTGAISPVSREDTLVWVGTENRQHFLGHMSLLGLQRDMVAPMCAGGPGESYVGDPVWSSLADWADGCHQRDGLVVIPHFPAPYCEVVTDVALGKVDGVELADFGPSLETYSIREWYQLLNAGFRVAVVGGTDKMSAAIPVGGVRTYAQIGSAELSFGSWAKAVQAGRTFSTSGPLIELTVEGCGIGDEVRVVGNGGTLDIVADAVSHQPLDAIEIVYNGRVVAREAAADDRHRLHLVTRLKATADGWIAARCVGPSAAYQPPWARWPISSAAHTSPVYVVGTGESNRAGDLAYLMTFVEGGLTWLDTLATQLDPERHDRVRARFLEARQALSARERPRGRTRARSQADR